MSLIDDAILFEQKLKLKRSGGNPVHYKWRAEFIIGTDVIEARNVDAFERNSDYIRLKSDINLITLQTTAYILKYALMPNKDRLRVKVYRETTNNRGDSNTPLGSTSQVFDAFLTDATSLTINDSSNRASMNDEELRDVIATVDLQLVDVELAEYRLIEVAGVIRNTRTDKLLQGLMTLPLKVKGGKNIGVDITEGDNKRDYFQILIPNGIRAIDLPKWVQNNYGVYSSKIGYYLQRGFWYIYPLLDYTRFNRVRNTLTILKVPTDEMAGADNSYIMDDSGLFVFATGDTKHSDITEHRILNNGNAHRYVKTPHIIDRFRDHVKGVSSVPKGRNIVRNLVTERPNGLNNWKTEEGFFTDNPWSGISELTSGIGGTVEVTWEHANLEVLYPGMAVKFLYKDDGKIATLYGILAGVNSITKTQKATPTDERYVTVASLTLHVQKET